MTKGPVLVIDDTDDVRLLVIECLQQLGHETHGVCSVKEAKEWLVTNTPPLVMLDIMMPDGNGLDLVRWIHARPGMADTPVIIMSAIKDQETAQDAISQGAADFLHKPMEFKTLAAKVGRFLPRKTPPKRGS